MLLVSRHRTEEVVILGITMNESRPLQESEDALHRHRANRIAPLGDPLMDFPRGSRLLMPPHHFDDHATGLRVLQTLFFE